MPGRECKRRATRSGIPSHWIETAWSARTRRHDTRGGVGQHKPDNFCHGTGQRIRPWVAKVPSKTGLSGAGSRLIHHQIKEGRLPNTSSLAAELSVSSKTVQRDLDYLRDELEAPIEFRREENGYAYRRDDYVLPFLPVDGQDLFSIGVAAQVLAAPRRHAARAQPVARATSASRS